MKDMMKDLGARAFNYGYASPVLMVVTYNDDGSVISIGGDSDTIGCIAGSIAEALFGIPDEIRRYGINSLPPALRTIVEEFENRYGFR